jgi:hypothetical protein
MAIAAPRLLDACVRMKGNLPLHPSARKSPVTGSAVSRYLVALGSPGRFCLGKGLAGLINCSNCWICWRLETQSLGNFSPTFLQYPKRDLLPVTQSHAAYCLADSSRITTRISSTPPAELLLRSGNQAIVMLGVLLVALRP